jgi:uncharacterized protein YuzE
MTFEYDREADALEISLSGEIVARTVEIDPGTFVDLDAQGHLVAIEVIRPMRRWPLREILESYDVDPEDAAVLHALWNEQSPYPFAEPLLVG